MTTDSSIQWTKHTFNPWWGCVKVHRGCKHCYAETLDHRWGGGHWGPKSPRRMILGEWGKPAQWNKEAELARRVDPVFCASMCDLFEDYEGPVVDQQGKRMEFQPKRAVYPAGVRAGSFDYEQGRVYWTVTALRDRVFGIIDGTPHLLWQLLTKRPENVMGMVPSHWLKAWPANVIIGTSPCDQATADKCIPELLEIPGRHFLSIEPMVGPVDITDWIGDGTGECPVDDPGCLSREDERHDTCEHHGIHQVIVGGESGPGAEPFDVAWGLSLIKQCRRVSVPVFIKQLGRCPLDFNALAWPEGTSFTRGGHPALKDAKGGDWNEWPAVLRVREEAMP